MFKAILGLGFIFGANHLAVEYASASRTEGLLVILGAAALVFIHDTYTRVGLVLERLGELDSQMNPPPFDPLMED